MDFVANLTAILLAIAALLGAVTALLHEVRRWKKPENGGPKS